AGPWNAYACSTAIHGIRRRSAASASWARIWAFSFTSSCWRAASHACGETIDGVCMAGCPPFRSFSGDLVMVVATSELDELLGLRAEARLHRCRSLVVGHELTWHRGIGRWELQVWRESLSGRPHPDLNAGAGRNARL